MILGHSATCQNNWSVGYTCCCRLLLQNKSKVLSKTHGRPLILISPLDESVICRKCNRWCFSVLMGNLFGTRKYMYEKKCPDWRLWVLRQICSLWLMEYVSKVSWHLVKHGMRYACLKFAFSTVCNSATHLTRLMPWPLGMTFYQCAKFHNFWSYSSVVAIDLNGRIIK